MLAPLYTVTDDTSSLGIKIFAGALVVALVPWITLGQPMSRYIGASGWSVAFAALVAFSIVSLGFHPTGPGLVRIVLLLLGLGLMLSVASFTLDDIRWYVAVPLLATTAIQAVVIFAQTATGSAIGFSLLNPGAEVLVTNGDVVRPQGMYPHVYVAAAIALLSLAIGLAVLPSSGRARQWFLLGLGSASASVATTHSRAALLGLLMVLGVASLALAKGQRHLRTALIVVAVTFVVPAVATAEGWQARFDDSRVHSFDDASLGRITLAKQALALSSEAPIVGVGPTQYLVALRERGELDPRYPHVVHNVPLLAAAELGIPAALVITSAFMLAGIQAWRSDESALLLYLSIVPVSMLDVVFYQRYAGILLLGVWAGVGTVLLRRGSAPPDTRRESLRSWP